MSYPDIPRWATSYGCSKAQQDKVRRFETAPLIARQQKSYTHRNPNLRQTINARWAKNHVMVWIEDALAKGLDLAVERKTPLDYLIEKEENRG